MKLRSISVSNFRCLKDIEDMPVHDLTVLIGENDAGKSSVLDAIELALSKKSVPIEDDYFICEGQPRAGEIAVELLFDIVNKDNQPTEEFLNKNGQLQYRVRFTKASRTVEVKGKQYREQLLNNNFPKLSAGDFDTILTELGIELPSKRNLQVRMQLLEQYIASTNPEQIEAWFEVKTQLDEFLPRFERYSPTDFREPEQMIFKTLYSVVENQLYESSGEEKELITPLKKIKQGIKASLDEKVQELVDLARQYNPKIKNLEIEPVIDFAKGFQTGLLYITTMAGSHHISREGEGTRKRLFMSILDWDRKVMLESDTKPIIRGYDEPDTHLHYEAQRRMYYSLRDITSKEGSNVQALICTHSLTMIDRAPARNINVLRTGSNGEAYVAYLITNNDSDIEEFLSDMSKTLGISNSAIFYERCFIFAEGPTEEHALPILYAHLYGSTLVEDGIKIINIEGCGGWENFVKLMGLNKKALMVFFLDADCNEPESSCDLNKETLVNLGFDETFIDTNVVYIGEKEFEDAFGSNFYVEALNDAWPKEDGTAWQESEINALKETAKFSEALVGQVFQRSVPQCRNSCRKQKVAVRVAKRCTDHNDIPEAVKQLFSKAREIAKII